MGLFAGLGALLQKLFEKGLVLMVKNFDMPVDLILNELVYVKILNFSVGKEKLLNFRGRVLPHKFFHRLYLSSLVLFDEN